MSRGKHWVAMAIIVFGVPAMASAGSTESPASLLDLVLPAEVHTGPASTELYVFLLDNSEHMSNYWDHAYADLVREYERLQAKGVVVAMFVFSNGTTPVVLVRQPDGAMHLEDREKHPIEGGKRFYDAQPYRAFGRALDIFEANDKTNKRITFIFWSSGQATDSHFQPVYRRDAVLRRWNELIAKSQNSDRLTVHWRMNPNPLGGLNPDLASFVAATEHVPTDRFSVQLADTGPLEIPLPLAGQPDRIIATRPIRFSIEASPSLMGIEYEVLAVLEKSPKGQVHLGGDPRAILERKTVDLYLNVSSADLQEGENPVSLEFRPKIADTKLSSKIKLVLIAAGPPPDIRVPTNVINLGAFDANQVLSNHVCADGVLELAWSNVTGLDPVVLSGICPEVKDLTVKLRPKDRGTTAESPYVTNGDADSPRVFELVLDGKIPNEPGTTKIIEVRVKTPRLPDKVMRARFALHIKRQEEPPPPPDVRIQQSAGRAALLPGEEREVASLTLIAPAELNDSIVSLTLADEVRQMLSNGCCDAVEIVGPDGNRASLMGKGADVRLQPGKALLLKCVVRAAKNTCLPAGEKKSIRLAIVIRGSNTFSVGGGKPGQSFASSEITLDLYGPARTSIAGEFSADLLRDVIVGQVIRAPRISVRNTIPGYPLPDHPLIRVYLEHATQLELAAPASSPAIEFDANRKAILVAIPEDGQAIDVEPVFRAVQAGSVDDSLVFDVSGNPALSLVDSDASARIERSPGAPAKPEAEVVPVSPILRIRARGVVRNPFIEIDWRALDDPATGAMSANPPTSADLFYGAQHGWEQPLRIRGRVLPGTYALRARLIASSLPDKSRLLLEPSEALAARREKSSLILLTGQEVKIELASDPQGRINAEFLPKLQLANGTQAAKGELSLEFIADDKIDITSGRKLVIPFSIRPPELVMTLRKAFVAHSGPKTRGWLGELVWTADQDWQSLFDNEWGQEMLEKSIVLNMAATKNGKKVPVPNVQFSRAGDSGRKSIQGKSVKEWLTAGPVQVFVPAWISKAISVQPVVLEPTVADGIWTIRSSLAGSMVPSSNPAESTVSSTPRSACEAELPPLSPSSPSSRPVLLFPLIAFVSLIGLVIWRHLGRSMSGRLVPETAAGDAEGYALSGGKMSIGSAEAGSSRIQLDNDSEVKDRHAVLTCSRLTAPGGRPRYYVPEIQALEGDIFLDGSDEPARRCVLEEGMRIRLGSTTLVYRSDLEPDADQEELAR